MMGGIPLRQAALMLRAPWQWLRNDGGSWRLGLCIAMLVVGGTLVAAWLWMPKPHFWAFNAAVGSLLLMLWWSWQFSALLRLDHPHVARFVVGHSRALRTAALALWLALVAGVGSVGGLSLRLLGLPGSDTAPTLLMALIAAAVLLYIAMALRWWWLWVALLLPFPLLDQAPVRAAIAPLAAHVRDGWQAQPGLYTLLALWAMAVILLSLFGQADASHARAYASREHLRKISSFGAEGQKATLASYGRWGQVLGLPFQRLTEVWLAHVIRRASPQRGSVLARAEVVLYGNQHWVRPLAGLVMLQGVVVAALAWLSLSNPDSLALVFERGHVGLSIGLSSMVIGPLLRLPGTLWATRREQALLMLLPGMPQGVVLNQALARRQLRYLLLMWAAALPGLAVLAWWGQAPQVWGLASTALPAAALVWRDGSRMREPVPAVTLWPYALWTAMVVLAMLLLSRNPGLLLPWVGGMLALTAGVLAWRWRRLSQWPQALPAGRLA